MTSQMTPKLQAFNALSTPEAETVLTTCCSSERWCTALAAKRPFSTVDDLLINSDKVWSTMQESDYLQAFDGHPQIGDVSTLKAKYQNTASSASQEQSAVNDANETTLQDLITANQAYLDKFGFIFIVFASGKTATQMLTLLTERLSNTREQELINGAREQNKITLLRLQNLMSD